MKLLCVVGIGVVSVVSAMTTLTAEQVAQKPNPGVQADSPGQEPEPSLILSKLHEAAAKADGERYFELFAPDAVFLGTDATERWTLDQFKAYAMKRFATGTGWTYTLVPGTRHINVAPGDEVAWFDELLDNVKYGRCRGSGVLRLVDGQWKIVQYNLSFTVPNDFADEVVALVRTRTLEQTREKQPRNPTASD